MKLNLMRFFTLFAVAAFVCACQKEEINVADPLEEAVPQSIERGTLVSATKMEIKPVTEVLANISSVADSNFVEIFSASALGYDIIDFEIATYTIKYNSVVRDENGWHPAVLTGSVAFIKDRVGTIVPTRILTSVSLINTIYNTSAADVTFLRDYYNIRAIYNALVVFPHYQGGDATDGYVVAPSEFMAKAKQAIDCELAALELIDSMSDVKMASGVYTDNIGISNGGGVSLAIQYLLENDSEYKQNAEKINLRSNYIGEGNCLSASMFSNLLKKYSYSEFGLSSVDMSLLAPVGYLSTVAGTYMTWKDKYFQGIKLEDFFSEKFLEYKNPATGKNFLEQYLANEGSLMFESVQGGIPFNIYEVVNPELLVLSPKDSSYSFCRTEGSIINNLYAAFKENEIITSHWTPKSKLVFAHSLLDEFLPFTINFGIYSKLSYLGFNDNVRFKTIHLLNHMQASTCLFITDILLRKHPEECVNDEKK